MQAFEGPHINESLGYWKLRATTTPATPPLMTPWVVKVTTPGATSHNRVGITNVITASPGPRLRCLSNHNRTLMRH